MILRYNLAVNVVYIIYVNTDFPASQMEVRLVKKKKKKKSSINRAKQQKMLCNSDLVSWIPSLRYGN